MWIYGPQQRSFHAVMFLVMPPPKRAKLAILIRGHELTVSGSFNVC